MKAGAILLLIVAAACAGLTVIYYLQYGDAQRFVENEYNKVQKVCRQASAAAGTPQADALANECSKASETLTYRSNMINQPRSYFRMNAVASAVSFCLGVGLLILGRRKNRGAPQMSAAD